MDDESIYSQLTTKTLSTVSATDINTQTGPIHLEKENEDILHSTVLVNQATLRGDGGPIPASSKVFYYSQVSSGSKSTILEPNAGEVYLLGPCSFQLVNNTGSVTIEQWLYAPDQDGTNRRVLVGNATSSSSTYATVYEGGPNTPIYVDENCSIRVEASGTFESVSFYQYATRVR